MDGSIAGAVLGRMPPASVSCTIIVTVAARVWAPRIARDAIPKQDREARPA